MPSHLLLDAFVITLSLGFLIWMLIDCLGNRTLRRPYKILWLIIILFVPLIPFGALAYGLFRLYQVRAGTSTRI
jgi:predicted PurR-regulated permease PerM